MTSTATVPLSMSPNSVAAASAFLPGAQHIGRADIAGADGANVGRAGKARQQDAEGNRAAEIAEDEGGGVFGSDNRDAACRLDAIGHKP